MPQTVDHLLDKIREYLTRRALVDDAMGGEAAGVLSLLASGHDPAGEFTLSCHPCLVHLTNALRGGNTATSDLIEAVRAVGAWLPWNYHYAERADLPGLGDHVAFAEIIGPEAPYRSRAVCVGLTMIAPRTLYPSHRHPATELYYVVAGTAMWTADGMTRENPPGTFILHRSQVSHAMQTGDEPLLAVYTWSGEDIITHSTYAD